MNTFDCPKDCNENPGRKEKTKNAVMQEGKNKPMGEKMTMKGRDTKMETNNSGAVSYTHLRAHETLANLVCHCFQTLPWPVSYTHLTLPTTERV